jgi:catechol 2,3-dioxygenase-like lactoylglutathione lyase family enzyme
LKNQNAAQESRQYAGERQILGEIVNSQIKTDETDRAAGASFAPQKLAHYVLRTSRYEQMLQWYKTVFGARVVFGNEILTFMTYDDEHHRFAFLNIPDLADQKAGVCGIHHTAFTYGSLKGLMLNYERLRDLNIKPVYVINHGPTTSLYYADPDGNQIELQVENYESVAASTEFFFSPAFATNPIGVEFDPDVLLRRLRAGESEEKLKERPDIGRQGLADVKLR